MYFTSASVDIPPDRVTSQDVFAWAYGAGISGRQPSSVTIGARLACLSSFYRFLIRMGAMDANPCDALERPRVSPSPPRGLSADEIRRLLDAIPETPSGLRDRAIVLTLVLTGRLPPCAPPPPARKIASQPARSRAKRGERGQTAAQSHW
jgi:site-specific recombinase XerD